MVWRYTDKQIETEVAAGASEGFRVRVVSVRVSVHVRKM